jgi:hypothetical protein
MTLRCPVCRAENASGPVCRRCRADLSLLAAIEARRAFHFDRAHTAIRDGHLFSTQTELTHVAALRTGPDVRRLQACLALLSGDFSAALANSFGTDRTESMGSPGGV